MKELSPANSLARSCIVAIVEKAESKKDESKEINLEDQVELLKMENCALLRERLMST